jgi:hypothetical protein
MPINRRLVAVSVVAFSLLGVGGCRGSVPGDQPAADVTIPLNPYFRDLRTVRAQVGTDTLTLLFDTGGGATLVTPAIAHRIGCRPHGRDVGHRMTGELVEFQRCDSVTLGLSGWSRQFAPVAVFDVNALLPPELPRLDGVLALDAFRGQVIAVDWPGSRVIVHSPTTGGAAIAVGAVPLRAATGESGRMLTVLAEVEGRRGPLWFLIDSGDLQGTLVDSSLQRDSLLIAGTDSLVDLRVGTRTPIRVRPHAGRFIMDGVLGTDFLQRGPVVLDLRRVTP